MSAKEMFEDLKINEWLELIKEDKNLKGAYICISQYIYLIQKENQELKKQLEENKHKGLYNTCLPYSTGYNKAIKEKENQQKEFMEYLESEIDRLEKTEFYIDSIQKAAIETHKHNLSKYKEIIGGIRMNHIENLRGYMAEDEIYQKYKKEGITPDMSDFDKFCIGHCEDIESVLGGDDMNIKFYYNKQDFSKNDGVKLKDYEIQDMIDDVIKRLDSPGEYSFSATGDTIVIGFRWEEGINIYVCKNYEHAEAWLDENGNWEKMDWSRNYEEEEIREKYEKFSRDELIEMLMRDRKPQYNPRKEV